jgi:hypothetical protein
MTGNPQSPSATVEMLPEKQKQNEKKRESVSFCLFGQSPRISYK